MAGTDVLIRFLGDASGAVDAMKQVDRQSESLSRNMQKVGAAMSVAVTLPLIALGKAAFDQASNLNESMSKSAAIFGQNSAAIERWASGAAQSFGQSKQQALESAASFGNMFKQLDIGLPVATKMSKSMVELASDFASFHNADITQVLEAQSAAFRGEYDAVQKFVPTINAAAVQTKALAMTGKDNAAALTEQDKAMAAYRLMVEGAGKALGDFDRTSGGAANQSRIVAAQMKDLQATLGGALIPAMQKLMGIVSVVASAFGALPGPVQTATVGFLAFLAAVGPVMTLAGSMGSVMRGMSTAFNAVGTAVQLTVAKVSVMGPAFLAAVAPIAAVAAGLAAIVAAAVIIPNVLRDDTFAKTVEDGEKLGRSMVNAASSITDLTAKHDQLTASLRTLKSARVDDMAELFANMAAQKQVKGALSEVEAAQAAAAAAARLQRTAIAEVATGQRDFASATNETRTAIEQLNNVLLGASNAAIAYELANINVAKAEREAAAAAAVYGVGSEEARVATLNLESAKNTAAAATMKLATADADLADNTDRKSIPALIAQRDAILRTAQAHGEVPPAVQEEINKLDRLIFVAGLIPVKKGMEVIADTHQAANDLAHVKTLADEATRPRTLQIDVLVPNIESLRSGLRGFATGGMVPGPKGKPMLAVVHGGEYITPVSQAAAMMPGATAAAGGSTATYNIEVKVEAGAAPAEVGAVLVDKIRAYERVAGRSWRG